MLTDTISHHVLISHTLCKEHRTPPSNWSCPCGKNGVVKACRETEDKAQRILNLGSIWRWVVRFTLWPFYPLRKRFRYALKYWTSDRVTHRDALDGVAKKKSMSPPGIELRLSSTWSLNWLRATSNIYVIRGAAGLFLQEDRTDKESNDFEIP